MGLIYPKGALYDCNFYISTYHKSYYNTAFQAAFAGGVPI